MDECLVLYIGAQHSLGDFGSGTIEFPNWQSSWIIEIFLQREKDEGHQAHVWLVGFINDCLRIMEDAEYLMRLAQSGILLKGRFLNGDVALKPGSQKDDKFLEQSLVGPVEIQQDILISCYFGQMMSRLFERGLWIFH